MSTGTKVKEKPVLFSGPMVRAILEGRKTQTRRIVKPQPVNDSKHRSVDPPCNAFPGKWSWWAGDHTQGCYHTAVCPYGKVGERLWVRESFADAGTFNPERWRYRATDDERAIPFKGKWKPSIHMPRWASRLTLEITDVRVERLQSISAKDILAEGVVLRSHENKYLGKCPISAFDNACYVDLISLWRAGWEKINGKGSWDANPFVWAMSFRRVES